MSSLRAIVAAAGIVLVSLSPALALDVTVPNPRATGMLPTVGDIQALQNRLNRQQFQQQQQLQREQDRQMTPAQPQVEIERVQPRCARRTYADDYVRRCP